MKTITTLLAIALIAIQSAACAPHGINGRVYIEAPCTAQTQFDDCSPRPIGAMIVITPERRGRRGNIELFTDRVGRFSVVVPPGRYTVAAYWVFDPPPTGEITSTLSIPRAAPVTAVVTGRAPADVELLFETLVR